jgi:hypothetical protein
MSEGWMRRDRWWRWGALGTAMQWGWKLGGWGCLRDEGVLQVVVEQGCGQQYLGQQRCGGLGVGEQGVVYVSVIVAGQQGWGQKWLG